MNDTGTLPGIGAIVVPISLSDYARQLARLRPKISPEMRPHVSKLIEQCSNYWANPDGLRPKILKTIECIEEAR